MPLPQDYEERVYAGVLGKIIAVYLGRPVEGWTYRRIVDELGEITYYVNDRRDVALKNHLLVVTDDDISGTFVFPRALREHPGGDPTPRQIGGTWLNHLIEDRTVLWWGGLGNSTEHTAYLRLQSGINAPESGSIARNGKVVAEQVGAQIFIEGFAMTRAGDPEAAADLVARAASVSHDGEALHAARVVGALVSGAFVETDMNRLLDIASGLIPKDSLIYRVIDDVRTWSSENADWRLTRDRIEERYGYHRYGGNCHIVPNHAVVVCALAHSGGDFSQAMTIVTTSGWDTDSNAGDVGSITGVFGGLAGLAAGPDWRGPIADRMYLPSADGGAAVTDAAREAIHLAALGRTWAGEQPRVVKDGARFHFAFPGSVQGFQVYAGDAQVTHTDGSLAIDPHGDGQPAEVVTPTFIPPEAIDMPGYGLHASPTLYPGQQVHARVVAAPANSADIACRLLVHAYDGADELSAVSGPEIAVRAGESADLSWVVPDLGGQPATQVGIAVTAQAPARLYLDRLTWDGPPDVTLTRPENGGRMWRRAWVSAVDRYDERWPEAYRLVQNHGTGMLIQGSRDWRDYEVTADVTPHLAEAVGLAARVQGLRRYYAVVLDAGDTVRLIRRDHDHTEELGRAPFPWQFGRTYTLALSVVGTRLRASVDGKVLLDLDDSDDVLDCGGVALLITEGRTATQRVRISPASTEEPA